MYFFTNFTAHDIDGEFHLNNSINLSKKAECNEIVAEA